MIAVYRGEQCAAEGFSARARPCGHGEHYVGMYRWGLRGDDNVPDPEKDSGAIYPTDAGGTEVFSYKDHWQPSKQESEEQLPKANAKAE